MRIYVVRHGQTEMNNRKALQGRSNYPLNEAGIAQAQKAAEELKHIAFAKVYTSPLKRAIQTAEIIAPYTPRSARKGRTEFRMSGAEASGDVLAECVEEGGRRMSWTVKRIQEEVA